jgi:hypothetical protein
MNVPYWVAEVAGVIGGLLTLATAGLRGDWLLGLTGIALIAFARLHHDTRTSAEAALNS